MGLRYRRRVSLGPVRLNFSKSGMSTSLKIGSVTVNPRRRSVWINLPGGFAWQETVPHEHHALRHHEEGPEEFPRILRLQTRNGVLWNEAPLPRRRHECEPWTRGRDTAGSVERCACGAIRLDGEQHPWMNKNSRRRR